MSIPTVITSKYREGQHLRHQSTGTVFEIQAVRVLHPEQKIGYELWCESLQLRLHCFEHEVERDFQLESSLHNLLGILKTDAPPPTDEECLAILEAELIQQHLKPEPT